MGIAACEPEGSGDWGRGDNRGLGRLVVLGAPGGVGLRCIAVACCSVECRDTAVVRSAAVPVEATAGMVVLGDSKGGFYVGGKFTVLGSVIA